MDYITYKNELRALKATYDKIRISLLEKSLVFTSHLEIEKYGIQLQNELKDIGINRNKFAKTLKTLKIDSGTHKFILEEYNKIIKTSDDCIELIKEIQDLLKKYKILQIPTVNPKIRTLRKEILGNKIVIRYLTEERNKLMSSGLYGLEEKNELEDILEKLNDDILRRESIITKSELRKLDQSDPDLPGVVIVEPSDYLTEDEKTERSDISQWWKSFRTYFKDGIMKSKRKSKTSRRRKSKTKTSRRRKSKTKTSRRRKSKTKTSRKRKTKRRTSKSRF